ncbi:D-2-hydroxyacid dehydrogenase [Paenibacillus puerhi]|uniref:D-2-hydroxyacid dehydrogenase n=1 Tax=Paenibacillus puerhi TaxID=2692622 RepID=UPI001359AA94|nr:D-2-hydroxyacid dehydrogenase [Paenibacillus puerhi]
MKIERILVTGRLHSELEQRLRAVIGAELRCMPEQDVSEQDLAWADAYAGFRPVPGFRSEQYRWVHALGAGVDAFIHRRSWHPATVLTRTTGDFGRQIAEYCLGYMLADAQRHDAFRHRQATREWGPQAAVPLAGQSAVVFGTGSIGQTVAGALRALGVKVWGVSLQGKRDPAFDGNSALEEATGILGQADWLINTLPLTEKTEAMFNAKLFHGLKDGCALINVGRGGSLVEKDLIAALDTGRIRMAVLDVVSEEPLPAESPLWSREEVKITPHIAALTGGREAALQLLDTCNALRRDQMKLPNRVQIERGY